MQLLSGVNRGQHVRRIVLRGAQETRVERAPHHPCPLSPRTSSMLHVVLFSAFRFSMPSHRKIS